MLWIIVVLGIISAQFSHSMRNEVQRSRYRKDEAQSYYIAHAGMNRMLFDLNQAGNNLKKDKLRVNLDTMEQPFGKGQYKIKLDNDSGKFNINYADRKLLKILIQYFEKDNQVADTIVDSILDWRDNDSLHRLNGAEDNYYQSLPTPYKCRDGYFTTVDELLLVRGVTSEMFFNGLKDVVSVAIIKKPKRIRDDFRGLININAASREVLSILPDFKDEMIEKIVKYRQEKDIESMTGLAQVIGAEIIVGIREFICYENNEFFTIESQGWTELDLAKQVIRAKIILETDTEKNNGYRVVQWMDNGTLP